MQLASALSGLSPQNFSLKIFFLIFRKQNFLKFQERNIQKPAITELSYPSRNGAFYPYIYLIFQEITFRALKNKKIRSKNKFLYFRKWKLLDPKKIKKTFLKFLAPKELNKTLLGETGCMSKHYTLCSNILFFNIPPFPKHS